MLSFWGAIESEVAFEKRKILWAPILVFDKCESAFFSSAQWPKDLRPNNYGLVDRAWFTAAKELFKNQVVHMAGFLQYK